MMGEFVEKLSEQSRRQGSPLIEPILRESGADLERVLANIDAMLDLHYVESFTLSKTPYVPTSKQYLPEPPIPPLSPILNSHTLYRMRLAIHRSVISEYRTVPQDLTTKIYRPLFDLLFQVIDADQFCLPIFTTNYDPAIEQFVMANQDAYELIDGLEYVQKARRALWCSEQFDRFSLAAKKRNLVLFKLHGSADWVNSGDTIWKSDALYLQPGTEEIENCLIYPATRKIATKDPYFTAYDYFRRCCDHARLCLSIGYSFRDYDALNQLQSAVHATESLTLALLSPNCLEVLKALPIPANRMGGLPFRFGDGEKESDYLAEIADLAKSTLAKRSSNDFA